MRARWIARWDGPLEAGERPEPRPEPGEVAIEVEACGVGLTVLNCIRGDLGSDPGDLPRVPGHELVGHVVDRGAGVDPALVGRRVMAYFYLFCGACPRCFAGQEPLCERLGGYVGVHRDGGYAERVALPARNTVPLPSAVNPVSATVIPDAIATPVHVCRRSGMRPGERVVVVAAGGGVGVHMVQVAQLHGADVAGLEASDKKLAFLSDELGVEPVDSSDFSTAQLPGRWGARADVVIDLLGSEASLEWSGDVLAPGGRLVLLTTFPGVGWRLTPRQLVLSEATVLGSRYASRHELVLAAQLVADERVRPVISQEVPANRVEELHSALRTGELLGRGALTWAGS
jgi:D-arabinose 1-dehydrogenase-like Zn-dependent alcohol dehydrogenase